MLFSKRVAWLSALVIGAVLSVAQVGVSSEATGREKPPIIVATDYPSINAAIEAARNMRVPRVYIPAGIYEVTKSLNLTGAYAAGTTDNPRKVVRMPAFVLEGAGFGTVLIGRTGKDPVIDMTAAGHCQIRDLSIVGEDADVGIFMGRKSGQTGLHVFSHIGMGGKFRKAAIYSVCSEVVNIYDSWLQNSYEGPEGNGDVYVFNFLNNEKVKSPYMGELRGPVTNTALWFHGVSLVAYGKDSVALRIEGPAGAVGMYGGYIMAGGFAGIYLDGSKGGVSHITLDGVRIESNKGKHALYATGKVHDIVIRGGSWSSSRGVPIRVEDYPTDGSKAHKDTVFPVQERAGKRGKFRYGVPYNWRISNIILNQAVWIAEEDTEGAKIATVVARVRPKESVPPTSADFIAIQFDALQDSVLKNITFIPVLLRYQKGSKSWKDEYPEKALDIAVEKYGRRNTFVVASRDQIRLAGDQQANEVVALHDFAGKKKKHYTSLWRSAETGPESIYYPRLPTNIYQDPGPGIRRTYIKADSGLSLLNLGTVDVRKIKGAKEGDIAIHDGSGFEDGKPRLAIFDGKEWIYFSPSGLPQQD